MEFDRVGYSVAEILFYVYDIWQYQYTSSQFRDSMIWL